MDEELKLAIKAYDEFQSVMAKFSGALEGVEKAEKTVAATTEALNKTVAVFLDSIQKTGPPLQRRKKATDDVADADKKAAKAAHDHGKAADDLAHSQDKAGKAAHGHKDALDDLIMGLGMLGITAAVARGFNEVVEAGAGFNRELTILKGMTGQAVEASEEFLDNLNVERKGLTELSQGMNELARAGYDAADAMTALPDIAEFSKASFKAVAEAGAPVLQILKTFQKDVRDTGEITDVLTTAANRSALGFDDFQLGLAMSAGVARIAGQSYQELIAELSVLRDAGLGASDAGTSIKSAWLALMNPTEEAKRVMADLGIEVYDAQGRMKTWADIVANVEKAIKPLNDQSRNLALTTIFGSDGVRAMSLSMGRGSEYIRALTADLNTSRGATAELAHEMGQSFTGSMERVQANLERLKITLFQDIDGGLTGLLGALDTLVVGFNSLGGGIRGLLEILVGGAGLIVGMASVVAFATKVVTPMLAGITTAFTGAATAAGGTSAALAALGGPVGVALLAVSALVVGVTAYAGAQERARQEEERLAKSLVDLSGRYNDLQLAMDDVSTSEVERNRAAQEQKTLIREIGDAFPQLVRRWDEHGNAVELDTERLKANTLAARENLKAKSANDLDALGKQLESLQRQREDIQRQIAMAGQPMSNAATGLFNTGSGDLPFALGDVGQGFFTKNTGELNKELAAVNAQIDEALAKMGRLASIIYGGDEGTGPDYLDPKHMPKGSGGGGGGKTYNPGAGDEADKAEKARLAAIKDQMDLLRHLMAMDDERVDTAQEQLDWLLKIRGALGTTRELDEAIHKIEVEIGRQPLQDQLAAFEKRKQLGEVTARQEQAFYEQLVANAQAYALTQQEIDQYQVEAAVAKKAADKEYFDSLMAAAQYNIDLTDASTAQQLSLMKTLRDTYAEGSEERKKLDLEVHELEKQLQEETHQAAVADIEWQATMNRWTNEQKLQALREYLAKATDLTIDQQRELQATIAQMQQQAERDHQQNLMDLFRQGLDAQRRISEANLRVQQRQEIKDQESAIESARGHYEDLLSPLRQQLESMQAQTRELERQNRLLELQQALQEKDQEIADAKKLKNRIVVEAGGPLGFTIRRTYDEAKVRDLEKDRAGIADDLERERAKQARERAQEALQEQIRLLEQERDERLETLNEELRDLRDKHGEQMEALNTYWTERLSTQAIQQELEKTGWKTHYADVLSQTQTWVSDMNKAWADLQQPTITNGADLAKSLGGTTPPPGTTWWGGIGGAGAQAGNKEVTVENNFYGDNHFDGVDGLREAGQALVEGAESAAKK